MVTNEPTAIGEFNITNDADGYQTNTQDTGTSDQSEYVYDEENRLSCARSRRPQARRSILTSTTPTSAAAWATSSSTSSSAPSA
jgi:hypothetical protein